MKTSEATRLYNAAEKELETINGKKCFIDRAMDIVEYLEKKHGDEIADEILELVFENEIM
jgi:hypothetical protein